MQIPTHISTTHAKRHTNHEKQITTLLRKYGKRKHAHVLRRIQRITAQPTETEEPPETKQEQEQQNKKRPRQKDMQKANKIPKNTQSHGATSIFFQDPDEHIYKNGNRNKNKYMQHYIQPTWNHDPMKKKRTYKSPHIRVMSELNTTFKTFYNNGHKQPRKNDRKNYH